MIRVYRLVHGHGPERDHPFRGSSTANHWNSGGTQIAYAAESIAVCALEILSQWRDYDSLHGYAMYELPLAPSHVEDVRAVAPDLDVHDHAATRAFGDAWVREARTLALRIPSVVVPFGSNFLVNPAHPRFAPDAVREIGEFRYDERIVDLIEAAKRDTRARAGS